MAVELTRKIVDLEDLGGRPDFMGITVDDAKVKCPEQAIGLTSYGLIHFSVCDIGYLLDDFGIKPAKVVERAFENFGNFVPKGRFEFNFGTTRPAISMILSEYVYQPIASMVTTEEAMTNSEVKWAIERNTPSGLVFAQVAEMVKKVEEIFILNGAHGIAIRERDRPVEVFATSTRLAVYTGALVGTYFQENSIPGLYVAYENGKKAGLSVRPSMSDFYGFQGALQWSSPARNKAALVNILQLSAHLRGRQLPFSESDLLKYTHGNNF
ncbi:hypothetical protein A2803_00345 [Candidatus Woesebacteria bacterium RIFCSPHIGHO2_01_FULL_44_21]|uniref:Uncharacterized protein n=1 Tax=Candidatus Woesebacteria bacterium RIFCSPHIGHO2_01_FULL_44_21 TaxID=1802503 RepID=A0A1F7YWE7_9BACT|nr:MAG: hypothetical protein A2803_00345 [Candidatus Woesebacteria bacterium RIFCSPHIGHO2_01_FULL_44_21]OGM68919.1 MAG: hypothetical protein A2897_02040 [Candidatus Woesebacteria bacterium RIFCSPLOWO2_01_FULL_44_24b]